MDRRHFLKFGISAFGLGASGGVLSNSVDDSLPTVLFVFLRGGADSLSMLVPYSDEFYYSSRPSIAVQKERCFEINSEFGISPFLEKSFYSWYKEGSAVFVPLAGQVNNSRSHFQAQDVMESGIDNPSFSESGFIARLSDIFGGVLPISFTENLSLSCRGAKNQIANLATKHISGEFALSGFESRDYSEDFAGSYKNLVKNSKIINDINVNNKNIKNYNRFEKVGVFLRETQYNVGFIDVDAFDTHAGQGSVGGDMKKILSLLDNDLVSFREVIGEKSWKNTLIVVMSEFGRTLKQNADGTEHGHGGLLSFFGGMVNGSQIAGDWLGLAENNLHQKRDLPVLYNNRDILSGVFKKIYGLNSKQLEFVFPGSTIVDFGIV